MSRAEPGSKASGEQPSVPSPIRTRLAHFAIFNPSIPPPSRQRNVSLIASPNDAQDHAHAADDEAASSAAVEANVDGQGEHVEVDKDDLEQAAQIVFYTCPSEQHVARDVILRQVGLVRGLMAFTSAVAPGDEPWWSVHSNNARMVVYVADGYHFYANLLDAKGWPDRLVADLLRRTYEDFCLLYGPLPLVPTDPDRANIQTFYSSLSATLDSSYLSLPPSGRLSAWIGHFQPAPSRIDAVNGALSVFKDDIDDISESHPRPIIHTSDIGILTPTQTYSSHHPALERHLRSLLLASLPVPPPLKPPSSRRPARRKDEETRKVSLGSWAWPFGSRPSTPASDGVAAGAGAAVGTASTEGVSARNEGSGSARSSVDTGRGSLVSHPASQPAAGAISTEQKSTWLGLGTVPSAIGGAVGSMGTIFGLRSNDVAKSSTTKASELIPGAAAPAPTTDETGKVQALPVAEPAYRNQPSGTDSKTSTDIVDSQSIKSNVEPTVLLSELADAQTDQRSIAAQVDWDGREFWLGESGWKRVEWTSREGMLLFMIHPLNEVPGDDARNNPARTTVPDAHVLSLFNKLSSIFSPEPTSKSSKSAASSSSRHPSSKYGPKVDSAIWRCDNVNYQVGEEGDMALGVFADLRDTILRHANIDEIYTRTSAPIPQKSNAPSGSSPASAGSGDAARSAFVGVKRIQDGEVYLAVGKADASLVDADNAMRNMLRSDPRRTI